MRLAPSPDPGMARSVADKAVAIILFSRQDRLSLPWERSYNASIDAIPMRESNSCGPDWFSVTSGHSLRSQTNFFMGAAIAD